VGGFFASGMMPWHATGVITTTNIRKGVALCSAIPPRWGEIIYVLCGYAKPTHIAETNIRKGVALCSAIPPRWGEIIYVLCGYAKPTRIAETNIRKGVALCSAIPPRWGEMIFSYAKTRRREANTDSQPRRFHAPGASTLHGMTLAVRFWCRGHTLHGICSG
jgi:NADH:ubiquinone oxidoreductase subunit